MVIFDITVMLQLDDLIQIIYLLHAARLNLPLLIDKVDRYGRVVDHSVI